MPDSPQDRQLTRASRRAPRDQTPGGRAQGAPTPVPNVAPLQASEPHDVMALPTSGQVEAPGSWPVAGVLTALVGAVSLAAAPWLPDLISDAFGWAALGLGVVALVLAWGLGAARLAALGVLAAAILNAIAAPFGHGERLGPLLILAALAGIACLATRAPARPLPVAPAASFEWLASGARLTIGTITASSVTKGGVRVAAAFTDASGALAHIEAEGRFPAGAGPRDEDAVVVWYQPDHPERAVLRYNRLWAQARRDKAESAALA